ncbi:MAG TPA: inorganic phosphate transporter, partial [Ktedonobacterales bacterium]|nr:inorganic phosphate transporter [Ktedonobacterales bacterium]
STKFQTPYWLFMLVAAGIGLGSLLGGLKVTETLAEKVTTMDHAEGLSANLVTALLVAVASNLGLPVSTTHVSSGAVIGVGLREGTSHVNWRVVRDMALAWVVTLPGAGLLGLAAYLVFELVHGGA